MPKRSIRSQRGLQVQYQAAYFKDEDGWYAVQALDFPGAVSQGKTLKEARYMIRDAMELLAEYLLEEGKPLPQPKPRAKAPDADLVEPVTLLVQVLARAAS